MFDRTKHPFDDQDAVVEKLFKRAAAKGNLDATFHVGLMYEHVHGNHDKAVTWYIKAAQLGHAKACWKAGRALELSNDAVEKQRGEKFITMAAEKGNANAQHWLGLSCAYEDRDEVKALEYFQLAAAQGHADAQYNVGRIHLEVDKDAKKAFECWLIAASKGNIDAQYWVLNVN